LSCEERNSTCSRTRPVAKIANIASPNRDNTCLLNGMHNQRHLTWPEILWVFHRSENPSQKLLTLALPRIRTCATCRENCGDLVEMLESGEIPEDVDYHDLVLIRSRRRARRIWERLAARPTWLRRSLKTATPLWGLVELLVEESRRQASLNPSEAIAFAESAIAMAKRLPARRAGDETLVGPEEEEPLGTSHQAEVLALAHAVLGNAYRVSEDLPRAGAQLMIAENYMLDIREGCLFHARARVLSMKGSLLTDIRQLREAVEVLQEAQIAARRDRPQDGELEAEIAVKLATTLGLLGDHQRAIHTVAALLATPMTSSISSRLRVALVQTHTWNLVRAGHTAQATKCIPDLKEAVQELGDPTCTLRVRWVEAQTMQTMGKHHEALEVFDDLQQAFVEMGCAHEFALLALEKSLVLHELGDTKGVIQSARTALDLLIPLQVSNEALCALSLVLRYAEKRRLQSAHLQDLLRWAEGGNPPRVLQRNENPE
jgi:tetratricopeptide (TPR) repeat protein